MHSHAERCLATKYIRLDCTGKGSTHQFQHAMISRSKLPFITRLYSSILDSVASQLHVSSALVRPNHQRSSPHIVAILNWHLQFTNKLLYSLLVVPLNILEHVDIISHPWDIVVGSPLRCGSLPKCHADGIFEAERHHSRRQSDSFSRHAFHVFCDADRFSEPFAMAYSDIYAVYISMHWWLDLTVASLGKPPFLPNRSIFWAMWVIVGLVQVAKSEPINCTIPWSEDSLARKEWFGSPQEIVWSGWSFLPYDQIHSS